MDVSFTVVLSVDVAVVSFVVGRGVVVVGFGVEVTGGPEVCGLGDPDGAETKYIDISLATDWQMWGKVKKKIKSPNSQCLGSRKTLP